MTTEISRNSFRPGSRYSAVHLQQGRMITDADWNESVDLLRFAADRAMSQVVGTGSPRNGGAGLETMTDENGAVHLWLRPGLVVAEGVVGELTGRDPDAVEFPFGGQGDLPASATPSPPVPLSAVYADVWDRTVTALEDPGLADPGLMGADTCTRLQRVVQVKWLPTGAGNEEYGRLPPPTGAATLTVTVRAPAAVGSYLFRLEVYGASGPWNRSNDIELVWSAENAAEQYAAADAPAEFFAEDRFYEYFGRDAELCRGAPPAPDTSWPRGRLSSQRRDPSPDRPWVRRWDGHCRLHRQDENSPWAVITEGLGVVAAASQLDPGQPLVLDVGDLRLRLDLPEAGPLLAGDHWLVPVRGEKQGECLLKDAAPAGIPHRYVLLGYLDENGQLMPESPGHFPCLTDLRASDVRFEPTAPGVLGDTPQTAQTAIQHLSEALAATYATGWGATVGKGGRFPDLASAVGVADTVILLPGEHTLPGQLDLTPSQVRRLRLLGGGPDASLHMGNPLTFANLDSVTIEALEVRWTGFEGASTVLACTGCGQVTLRDITLAGVAGAGPLLQLRDCDKVVVENARIAAIHPSAHQEFAEALALLAEDGAAPDCTDALLDPRQVGPLLTSMTAWIDSPDARRTAAGRIVAALPAMEPAQTRFLTVIVGSLRGHWDTGVATRAALTLRAELLSATPGSALGVGTGCGDVTIADCTVTGDLRLYGTQGNMLAADVLARLTAARKSDFNADSRWFADAQGRLSLIRNQLSGVQIADNVYQALAATPIPVTTLGRVFARLTAEDNTMPYSRFQVAAEHVRLRDNYLIPDDQAGAPPALAVGTTGIYMGNAPFAENSLYNGTTTPGGNARAELNAIYFTDPQ